ncbi:MAG: hypothetical protein ACYDCN_10615 [Bacteroidia bacterium]
MTNKRIIIKTIATSIVAGMLVVSGCTKDATTVTGATGPKGANGTNGNANVTSQTDTAKGANNWATNSTNTGWFVNFPSTNLDSVIQKKGTVQVFMSHDDGTTWTALPLTEFTSTTNNYTMGFTTQVYLVSIQWTNTSASLTGSTPGSSPTTIYGGNCIFKIICIAASARMANPNVNLQNYEEVKTAFHLR